MSGDADVATKRKVQLEELAAARAAVNTAEHSCLVLRGLDLGDRELLDALGRIQEAHGLLWRLSRILAGDEVRNATAPLRMSIEYVAWVFADHKADHWTAQLLRLMAKADAYKLHQLAQAFPAEHAALLAWRDAPFGDVQGDGSGS